MAEHGIDSPGFMPGCGLVGALLCLETAVSQLLTKAAAQHSMAFDSFLL
jgi:hypothetical protein